MEKYQFDQALTNEIKQMCRIALAEDLNQPTGSDITAELISSETLATATLITREPGVICGTAWLNCIFEILGGDVSVEWLVQDGDQVEPEQILCRLHGNAQQLLTGERSAMNFLQTLSATATATNQYVKLLNSTQCKLLDTRKTIPGMRYGQKYAVQCGGGVNHRVGLHDAYLIKENHIMACGGIRQALSKAIELNPDKLLEIEVESIEELKQAIDGKAQVIMLDNFSLEELNAATKLTKKLAPEIKLEASGNVNEATIKDISATGIDYISVGALTKHINALDLSLRINLVQ